DWGRVALVWSRQYSGRISGEGIPFSSWIMNVPRGLVYFLPWLPLALLTFDRPVELRRRSLAFLLGITIPFLLVNVLPGALPRYAMPALGPVAWWFGELLTHENLRWPQWLSGKPFTSRLRDRIVIVLVV